jgi:phospholipid/cholesterol/gamma-HCH transport system substrate-binding protein
VRRAIRTYGFYVALIVAFAVLAVVSGIYIVIHQRLRLPYENRYTVRVEFPNSTGLTPGLGQPANVSGVKVGEISGVTLQGGRSLVTMTIDPGKLRHVYTNANAVLFPNTPLQDMEININPGSPSAGVLPSGRFIPLARTTVPIQSDSLLNALDGDTRAYFTALISDFGTGLNGRGKDLRELLRALGPTTQQIHELAKAFAARRVALQRLVHNFSILAVAAGKKDSQLGQVVVAGNQTLGAIASQDAALARSIALLPGTLSATQRSLGDATRFANQLSPTLQSLEPAARALPGALKSGGKLIKTAVPVLRSDVKPFIGAALTPLSNLLPTTTDLTQSTPHLAEVAQVLEYLADELMYNPGGSAHSYLFWLSWFAHNADSVTSGEDAYGGGVRGFVQVSCSSLSGLAPGLQSLFGLLLNTGLC